jgi:23S rRNA pseudouridine955/2504/2580 synthase
LSLGLISRLLRQGKVSVDGVKRSGDFRVASGNNIEIVGANNYSPLQFSRGGAGVENANLCVSAPPRENLQIIYEGDGILIVNKPKGIPVHGDDSLETQVREYLAPKLPPSLSFKPGPLHRLDQGASGLVAFGTSLEGARWFSGLLQKGLIKKNYRALALGIVQNEEAWEDSLVRNTARRKTIAVEGNKHSQSKQAITKVKPLKYIDGNTLLEVSIETGRTHQIRAQCALHGHPLKGDIKYGGGKSPTGYYLHAWKLELPNGRVFVAEGEPY